MVRTNLLVLTICSFGKQEGGDPAHLAHGGFADGLPARLRDQLISRRDEVRKWLVGRARDHWQGQEVREMAQNARLTRGAEFGGTDAALYLPAIYRYDGRFYTALGDAGRRAVLESANHFVIISGLYGLLTPAEPIQNYSCPVTPQSASLYKWTRPGATLTDMLVGYARGAGIKRVVGLVPNSVYREMVDWTALKAALGNAPDCVLHAHSRVAAGDAALAKLGKLTRDYLVRPEAHELIASGKAMRVANETFVLSPSAQPPAGWPREVPVRIRDLDDEVDRNRRGVVRLLDRLDPAGPGDRRSIGERIGDIQSRHLLASEYVGHMRTIKDMRNDVVYRHTGLDLDKFRRACEAMHRLAPDIAEFDTDWDEIVG